MRINNQSIPGVHKAYEQQKKTVNFEQAANAKKKDDLEISAEGRLWGLAAKALKELPEPSRDLSDLYRSVSAGTYEVNNEELAEKIWQERC